jgi:hypothetical protein
VNNCIILRAIYLEEMLFPTFPLCLVASLIVLKELVTVFSTVGALFIIVAIALVSVNDNNSSKKSAKSNVFLDDA